MNKNHQEIVKVPKTVDTGSFLDTHSRYNFLPEKRKKISPVVRQLVREKPVVEQRKKLCRLYPELCPKGD